MASIPSVSADAILHSKDTDLTERLVFPVTRYSNILNAPNLISDRRDLYDAPFTLLITEKESLTHEQIREFCGSII